MRRVLCLLFVAACADDDDVEPLDAALPVDAALDAGLDAASVDAGPNGEASGTLKVFCAVTFQFFPRPDGDPIGSFRAVFDVRDLDDQPVDGANVQLEAEGIVYDAQASGAPGGYQVALGDLATHIRVDVDRGRDFLHGATLRAPSSFVPAIAPQPPVHLQPAIVTWAASLEPDTASVVQVFDARSAPTHPSVVEDPEDGSSELPATAFPATGTYELRVERTTTTELAGPQSQGTVRIGIGTLLTVTE